MPNSDGAQTDETERRRRRRRSAIDLLNNLSAILSSRDNRMGENASRNDGDDSDITTTFDPTLAAKHEYLGSDLEELRGRTLHDEGSIVWLPILPELGVVLVPGQILPLTVFYPPTITMLREIISKDRTFGVVCVRNISPHQRKALAQFGTTAEIFQFQEDGDLAGFKIKARGRQRFKLLEQKRHMSGIILARVLILPEVSLLSSLHSTRITSLDRYRRNKSAKSKNAYHDAVVTPWPDWVHKLYDPEHLVTRVTLELKTLKLEVASLTLPSDPLNLSYWVAQCLPLDDIHKVEMLSLDSVVERLQYALTLLAMCQQLYCQRCGNQIGDRKDIFSMSTDGPQGTYCNPGGHVHETLTLYKAAGLKLANDPPSTEYSWFPGYGWTIATCENCDAHIGWSFTAMKSELKPAKFWGLTRRSVTTHRKEWVEEIEPEVSLLL